MTHDTSKPIDDSELREWMDDWQSAGDGETPVAAGLDQHQIIGIRRRVRRFSVWLVLVTICELVLLTSLLTWMIHDTRSQPTLPRLVGLAIVILLVILAQGFSLWNRRGTWRPAADTTRAFVELTYLRCRRQLRTLRYTYYLLGLELVLLLPWRFWLLNSESETPVTFLGFASRLGPLAMIVAGLLVGLAIWGRRVRRTLEEATALKRNLEEGDL